MSMICSEQRSDLNFTADDSARFLRLVSEGARVRRHFDVYQWLSGDVQRFLPHDILICAWGEFTHGSLHLDVTSGLPGVRTSRLGQCALEAPIRAAWARWRQAGERLLRLDAAELFTGQDCACALHQALRGSRSLLIHGVRDQRSSQDSLYLVFSRVPSSFDTQNARSAFLMDALFAQIDGALRRVGILPVEQERGATQRGVLDLSAREREILERVCVGNTNLDIAAALDNSPFTVKNHVQRIFRKIGVTNRTQAAARYTQAMRERELAQVPSTRPAEAPGTWQVARPHAVAAASFGSTELSSRASR